MKAYLVIYGYEDELEVDSVFLDKKKAEAYIASNNQIPFDKYDKLRMREIALNPHVYKKSIVVVHGYINKNEEIKDLKIERIDRDGLEYLKYFTNDNIYLYSGKLYGEEDVVYFDGMIDVTLCKDLTKCDEYIKDIVVKRYSEYKAERR